MEFYSNSKPNLIGSKIKKSVYTIVNTKPENSTISDKISNFLTTFYKEYIQKNKFITFLIVAVILFLVYRFLNRGQKKEYYDENSEILNELIDNIEKPNLLPVAINQALNSSITTPNHKTPEEKKNNYIPNNIPDYGSNNIPNYGSNNISYNIPTYGSFFDSQESNVTSQYQNDFGILIEPPYAQD